MDDLKEQHRPPNRQTDRQTTDWTGLEEQQTKDKSHREGSRTFRQQQQCEKVMRSSCR